MKRLLGLLVCVLALPSAAEVVVPIDSVEFYVNIRMSRDAKSEIVGRLYQGDSAVVVRSSAEWHEVEIVGGATGFISVDWTILLDEVPAPMAEVEPEPEPVEEAIEDPVQKNSEEPAVEATTDPAEDVEEVPDIAAESEQEEIGTAPVAQEVSEELVADEIGEIDPHFAVVPVVIGEPGPQGETGPPGPPGPSGAAQIEGSENFLVKFTAATVGGNS